MILNRPSRIPQQINDKSRHSSYRNCICGIKLLVKIIMSQSNKCQNYICPVVLVRKQRNLLKHLLVFIFNTNLCSLVILLNSSFFCTQVTCLMNGSMKNCGFWEQFLKASHHSISLYLELRHFTDSDLSHNQMRYKMCYYYVQHYSLASRYPGGSD